MRINPAAGYYYVYPSRLGASGGASGCACGRRGHATLGRDLARCLARAGAAARAFYVAPGDPSMPAAPRELTRLELDALPRVQSGPGQPRTARGMEGKVLGVRVSVAEKQRLESTAAAHGMVLADYVRMQLGLPLNAPRGRKNPGQAKK